MSVIFVFYSKLQTAMLAAVFKRENPPGFMLVLKSNSLYYKLMAYNYKHYYLQYTKQINLNLKSNKIVIKILLIFKLNDDRVVQNPIPFLFLLKFTYFFLGL